MVHASLTVTAMADASSLEGLNSNISVKSDSSCGGGDGGISTSVLFTDKNTLDVKQAPAFEEVKECRNENILEFAATEEVLGDVACNLEICDGDNYDDVMKSVADLTPLENFGHSIADPVLYKERTSITEGVNNGHSELPDSDNSFSDSTTSSEEEIDIEVTQANAKIVAEFEEGLHTKLERYENCEKAKCDDICKASDLPGNKGNIIICRFKKNEAGFVESLEPQVDDHDAKNESLESQENSRINELLQRMKNGLYKCMVCQYESSYRNDCVRHIMIHTGEKPFACNLCSYKSNRKDNLKKHLQTKHKAGSESAQSADYSSPEQKEYQCKHCSYATFTRTFLTKHVARAHMISPVNNGEEISSSVGNDQHNFGRMKFCENCHAQGCDGSCKDELFSCKLCAFDCCDEDDFHAHMEKHKDSVHTSAKQKSESKGKDSFVCGECSARFVFRKVFVTHLKTHAITVDKGVSDSYYCKLCSFHCDDPNLYNDHLSTHGDDACHRCQLCPKVFRTSKDLKRHVTMYHDHRRTLPIKRSRKSSSWSICSDKPFQCKECGYCCDSKNKLNRHEIIHTGFKPFACEICSYRSNRKSNLKLHVDKVHRLHKNGRCKPKHVNEEILSCVFCEYKTSKHTAFQNHVKCHSDVAFVCPHCTYKCISYNTIASHIEECKHKRKFSCNVCPFIAFTRTDLQKHAKKHKTECEFFCPHCSFKCGEREGLEEHVKVHITTKTYSCPHCLFECSKKSKLHRHVQNEHK